MDEKTLTMEELKSVIGETLAENSDIKSILDLKTQLEANSKSKEVTAEEKAKETKEFITKLVTGKMESKVDISVTDATASMGYTVPTSMAAAIAEKKDAIAKIRKNAFTFKLDGNFELPVDETACDAYWISTNEDAAITESAPTVDHIAFADNYLAVRVRLPLKLLNTAAFDLQNYVTTLGARALTLKEEVAYVGGSGTGEPKGLRIETITDVPQVGDHYAYSDLIALFYALPEQYRANAKFLTSAAGMAVLRGLKDLAGIPLFTPNDNSIFGKEVMESANIPANLGGSTKTEIYFGDFSYYWIKDGQSLQATVTPLSDRLQRDLIVFESTDGHLTNADAFRKQTAVIV